MEKLKYKDRYTLKTFATHIPEESFASLMCKRISKKRL